MKARLERIEPVTQSSKTFWFRPERPLRYLAGQYLEIVLPHANADNRGERRWFSLSSSPTEPLLGFTIKFQREGGSSFKRALLALRSGDEVTITDPLGDFVLPKDPSIPLVFIAAGIGITPVRSMVQWLIDKQETRNVQLVYITRTPGGMAFLPLLSNYSPLRLTPLHTQQARPTTEIILNSIGSVGEKRIYLSGPQPLIEGLYEALQQHGVSREQLVLDYFPGYVNL
jgi:ferredoxin-NADP reductase